VNLIILLLLFPFFAYAQCPAGLDNSTYGYGNEVCSNAGNIRQIIGTLNKCPAGFSITQDKFGNAVCSDGKINAYDLSKGCPYNLRKHWDRYGRTICMDVDGQPVVELVK
jgi:hypothetical protein